MLTTRFEEALVYATQLHAAQNRKGTKIPYIAHLLAVASLVLEHGGTENEAIAALLHDAIEDQGGDATRQEISRRFGPDVTAIVDGCTDADIQPKPPWKARKEQYISHLASAPPSVLLVSCADKLHNARAILADMQTQGDDLWTRFNAGKDEQLWYYRALANTFTQRLPSPLSSELNEVVTRIEQLARSAN